MVPLEPNQIKARRVIEDDSNGKFLKETEWGAKVYLGSGSVPILYVARDKLPDPLELYSKILDMGNEYGLVKLVVEGEEGQRERDSLSILSLHADIVWFRSRTQFLKSFKTQRRKILRFHRRLYSCHKNLGHVINKVPSIDKRTLDLYRLWRCVQLRGGYKQVCQRKLWAQIGRELGYSGRIMSSLSTSLRSAYVKVLLDLELDPRFLQDEEKSDIARDSNGIFEVSNSKPDIKLLKGLKKFKGFKSNSHNIYESKKNFNTNYLPGYDLTNWIHSLETYDTAQHEKKNLSMYNLRQYYEKSIEYDEKLGQLNQGEISLSHFEKIYWQNLASPITIDVDTSLDLPSVKHNFNLLTCLQPSEREKMLKDPWQLNRLPLHRDSLLKFLDLDLGEFTYSHIDVGMLFSTKSWSMGPLGMPSLHYNHLGSTKIWYSVPPSQWDKFQNLLKELNHKNSVKENEAEEEDDEVNDVNDQTFDATFKFSDIHKSFLETNQLDQDGKINVHNIFDKEPPLNEERLTNELVITPDVLTRNGITLNKITQECGTYIFKFPRTHTFNVDTGFCLSECANFAPFSWLDKHWFKTIENDRIISPLPRIDPFQFLMKIFLNSNDSLTIDKCRNLLKDPIEKELRNRVYVQHKFISKTQIVENRFDYISDLSLQPTGASKVVLCNDSDCVTLSLREFLDMVVITENGSEEIFGLSIDDRTLQVQLHLYYDDSILKRIIDLPYSESKESNIFDNKDLDSLVNVQYANKRIAMSCAKEILSTRSGHGVMPLIDALKHAELLKSECGTILERVAAELINPSSIIVKQGEGFNLVDLLSQSSGFCDLETLGRIESEIKQCSIEFPEMTQFLQLCEEVNEIQSEAQMAMKNQDLEILEKCFALNCSLGIKNDLIAFTIGKLSWLRVYHDVFENPYHARFEENPKDYSLDAMSWFLIFGTKYCGPEDLDKLNRVKTTIAKTQALNAKFHELFKGKKPKFKISVQDIASLSAAINQEKLPLNPELVKLLKAIAESVDKVRENMVPIWKMLSVDEQLIEQLKFLIKNESIKSFELFPKFNGGPDDKRIQLKDVSEQKLFIKQRKACKLWLADASRLCSKNGIDKLKHRLENCLDLTKDVIRAPGEPTALYCFCREADNGATMVECEICKEWYHTKCIKKGSWKLPDESVFICSLCSPDDTIQDEYANCVDFNDVTNLVLESLDLKLLPDRNMVFDLFTIYGKMMVFKKKMERELFQDNGQLNPDIPLHNVKFFLRKAYGAKCNFGNVNKILKDYCKSRDAAPIDQMAKSGHIVVTDQPQQLKQEKPSFSSFAENTDNEDEKNKAV
ncbi:ZYRO0E07546p [Zygosaccharomyces rouxii]|uniref:ZYRO0E07546p n=1 Tax=Zygosaccharomyces rouxii (strain ATCC 2623 / CBS 732 / NBRC 1130 / NCYC 568 / NRRL Y-229) TaxID=559307 RepID=C5E4N6_ZYGRC|nr:uncharacterized protein ZYRO0E07546g [Zygosaccharomyces rouxii]KAH9198147.1 hypothetical protein LQ764DRAFT_182138 [Zygosaccharomyces rouxii]CAR30997.1 ZYRO0E07546p [Zygosaccharomyces rouxii]